MQSHSTEALRNENEIEMKNFIEKKRRLARIQEIEDQSKSTTATSWSVLIFSTFATLMGSIQDAFRKVAQENPIFPIFFPDNPGTRELLSSIGYSLWSGLLKFASPIALGLQYVNTGLAFKRLWEKENRSLWDYANALLSLAGTVAWTVLFALGISKLAMTVVAGIMSVPYLLPTIFGVYALYAVAKCAKNCYHAFKAWRAGNMDECYAHLKNAGRELLSCVTNTLGAVISYVLTVEMMNGVKQLFSMETLGYGIQAITECFDKISVLLYPLAAAVATTAVVNTVDMNKETLHVLRHPLDSIQKAWYALKANPVSSIMKAVQQSVKLPIRLAAFFILGPIQGVVKLGVMGVNKVRNYFKKSETEKSVVVEAKPVADDKAIYQPVSSPDQPKKSTTAILLSSAETKGTSQRIDGQLDELNKAFPREKLDPAEIQAKKYHLSELSKLLQGTSKYNSVAELESDSKELSRHGLYRNYFSPNGSKVQAVTEEVRMILSAAAPAA